ncbi:MAG: hypothetical protein IT246_02735 [Bacteroidia bacterium]|nr:hypothetical protein [Bacteroidia bacterium]
MQKSLYSILLLLIVSACNRNDPDSTIVPSIGKEFYPIKIGSLWEYKVDSIAYDDNSSTQAIDTFSYQYKEQVTDMYLDDLGIETYIINRWFRLNDSAEWYPARNYQTRIADYKVERVEENVRIVKLVLPLKERNSWNGNMFNNKDYQIFKILNYQTPLKINGNTHNAMQVEESNIDNFVEEIKKNTWYGEGYGMIKMQYDSLNTQSTGTKGFRYTLTIHNYQP